MNTAATIKKLQQAIVHHGLIININKSQFYSTDKKCFIPVISLTTRITYLNKYDQWREKNFEILKTTSQTDILLCLVDIYKAVSGGTS